MDLVNTVILIGSLTTSLISAFSNLKISSDIAMTGEMTLRGNILPIGGLRDKSIGAKSYALCF